MSKILYLAILLSVVALYSCSTTGKTPSGRETEEVDVGYGKQDSRNVTGAISTQEVKEEEFTGNQTVADILRRTSGVWVVGSGQNAKAYVRGVNSHSSNAEPLYIVDGMVVGNDYQAVANLDINEIKKVSVLKDSAASIYGSRGINGVILIEMKKN